MNRHPIDATALIFGLLFTLSGFAIVSDEVWPDIDTTAVVGAVVGALGLVFVTALVMRQLREGSQPPTVEPHAADADADAAAMDEPSTSS